MIKNSSYRTQINEWFEKNSQSLIADLGKLIAVNSVKTQAQDGAPYGVASREVMNIAASMLEEKGFSVTEFEDMIITADLGSSPMVLGVLAHLDIVEAGEGWETNPFEMTIKDGKIYGRGAIDNKGPAVALMYALYCVRDICKTLKSGVRLILGTGEETGCDDIKKYLEKNEIPPNIFSPDAYFPVVNTEKGRFALSFGASWEKSTTLPRVVSVVGGSVANIVPNKAIVIVEGFDKGFVQKFISDSDICAKTGTTAVVEGDAQKLSITIEGKATHASTPEIGVNAQTALIEMLAAMPFSKSAGFEYLCKLNRLFAHKDYHGCAMGIKMSDEISGDLTVNFGVLQFTENGFTGGFDSRTPLCADKLNIEEIVTKALEKEGIGISESSISHCHHTDSGTEFVQTLLRVFEDYTGRSSECLTMGGQTYVHDIPGGVAFGSAMFGENYNIHGVNEWIGVDELINSAKMYTQVILDMCAES